MNFSEIRKSAGQTKKLAFTFIIVVFVIVGGRFFLSLLLHNLGSIYLSKAVRLESETATTDLIIAEDLFERATYIRSENRRAWRGLGYTYLHLLEFEKSREAWAKYDNAKYELVKLAQENERQSEIHDAFALYDAVNQIYPEWGDGWYRIGLFYKNQGRFDEAISAFQVGLEKEQFDQVGISDVYFEVGQTYLNVEPVDDEMAVKMYEIALHKDQFSTMVVKAECAYKLGELYERKGYALKDVVEQYETAVISHPSHHWARLRYSFNAYQLDKNLSRSVQEIQMVINVWSQTNNPSLKWAYRFLGDIYFDSGKKIEALDAYQQASLFAKDDPYLLRQIDQLESQ